MKRAAVALLHRDRKILICQRKRSARYALKWEFPGGKVEEGESTLECLKRELQEELSIEIAGIDRQVTRINHYDDGGTFRVAYCFVSRFSGTPQNNAFEDILWVSLETLRTMDILSGNRLLVDSLSEEDLASV